MSNRKIIAVLYFKKEDVFNLFDKHIVCCSSDINLLISMIEPNMNAINKLRNCLQNNSKDYFNKGFSDVERLISLTIDEKRAFKMIWDERKLRHAILFAIQDRLEVMFFYEINTLL